MNIIDFFSTLFLRPVELAYSWMAIAAIVLLSSGWIAAWFIAFFHAKYARSWRELLSTASRLRVSWAWGWCNVAFLLLLNLLQLVYRDRLSSLLAAIPYLVAVPMSVLIATLLRHGVRTEVRRYQQMVQGEQG